MSTENTQTLEEIARKRSKVLADIIVPIGDDESNPQLLRLWGNARDIAEREIRTALAKQGETIEALRGTIESILCNADCSIPFYAYGDNEAACDMAGRLKAVVGLCEVALSIQPSAQGKLYGYNCPICGEPIAEPQPTEHTEDGLAHADCCTEPAAQEGEERV